MYAFFRAIIDAILNFVGANAGKGTQAKDATARPDMLRRGGSRIADYIRLRGVQSRSPSDGSKPDTDRP